MELEMNTEQISQAAECITNLLQTYNSGITQEQFYSANILDVTGVAESDMQAVGTDVVDYCTANGALAALPPFERGSFIDVEQGRYISWEVIEVGDDYFRLKLDHYPRIVVGSAEQWEAERKISHTSTERKCWYRSCHMILKVKQLSTAEHREVLSHHPDYVLHAETMCGGDKHKMERLLTQLSEKLKSESYVGGVIEECEFYLPQDFKRICKKGKYYTSSGEFVNGAWVRELADPTRADVSEQLSYGLHTVQFTSMGPMLEMFTYVNYMLSLKSTTSSTLRHITSVYAPAPTDQDPRKERHFGKIKMVSEKKPRAVNAVNVQRVYTTLSWQRRSHLRHYASGKVVPIKSTTCRRRGAENTDAAQVVYKI